MGRPGSGKGTQARLLAEKIGGKVFSSGAEFRSLAAGQTFVGKRIKAAMEGGELMPHWLASYFFEKALFALEPEDTIVFEGACRTEPESVLFHEISQWLGRPYRAIYLNVSEEGTIKRLLLRAQREGRKDDNETSIRKRFEEFNVKNEPSINHFRIEGTLVEVNADQPIEVVHEEVLKALKLS